MTSTRKSKTSLAAALADKKLIGFDTSALTQVEHEKAATEPNAASALVIRAKVGNKVGLKPKA